MRSALFVHALLGSMLGLCSIPAVAEAQSTIRHPGQRPHYSFEAEPHLLVGPFDPPGWPRGDGWGVGFRGTVELAPNAFMSSGLVKRTTGA